MHAGFWRADALGPVGLQPAATPAMLRLWAVAVAATAWPEAATGWPAGQLLEQLLSALQKPHGQALEHLLTADAPADGMPPAAAAVVVESFLRMMEPLLLQGQSFEGPCNG